MILCIKNCREDITMIDFEEELKRFQPSLEIEQAEESIYNNDLTDATDIIKELLKQAKNENEN